MMMVERRRRISWVEMMTIVERRRKSLVEMMTMVLTKILLSILLVHSLIHSIFWYHSIVCYLIEFLISIVHEKTFSFLFLTINKMLFLSFSFFFLLSLVFNLFFFLLSLVFNKMTFIMLFLILIFV